MKIGQTRSDNFFAKSRQRVYLIQINQQIQNYITFCLKYIRYYILSYVSVYCQNVIIVIVKNFC